MTSASSWASAARGWTSSTTSEACVEARRRRLASGPFAFPVFLLAVLPVFLLAAPPVFRWLRHRCSGRRRARPPAHRPRRELCSARRLEARPGPADPLAPSTLVCCTLLGQVLQALPAYWLCCRCSGPRQRLPHWWRAVSGVCCVIRACGPVLLLLAVLPVFWAPSGPPARSPSAPRALLGASARSPARPCGPAGALHTGGSWGALPGLVLSGPRGRSQAWFLGNVARNSPATASNLEFASLELQRFERRLKTDRGKLRATFIRRDPVAPPAPSALVACSAC